MTSEVHKIEHTDIERAIEGAVQAAATWNSPDRTLLEKQIFPVPRFPLELFGSFGSWIAQTAKATSAPVDYVAFALLAHSAALIGNSVRILPDPERTDWSEPQALWVALVGPPSSGKTPALQPFIRAFSAIEERLKAVYDPIIEARDKKAAIAERYRKRWDKEVDEAISNGEPPLDMPAQAEVPAEIHTPRIRVIDATIEKLARILSYSRRGVLQFRDELSAWIVGMGRYSNGSDRAQWLELFNSGTITVDRVKHDEPIRVPEALASVLGGIQPGRLDEVMETPDDGFLARFLFIWPCMRTLERADGAPDMVRLQKAFDRLHGIQFGLDEEVTEVLRQIVFDKEAADRFFDFRQSVQAKGEQAHGLLEGWIGKGPGIVARIAGLLALLEWSVQAEGTLIPTSIGLSDINRAIMLWEDYLLPMAKRTFGEAALPIEERAARRVLREILARKDEVVNQRDVRRSWGINELCKDAKLTEEVFKLLAETGWLKPVGSRSGETPGRKTKDWEVNPLLFES